MSAVCASVAEIVVRRYGALDDPPLAAAWQATIGRGGTWTVFQEHRWALAWWAVYGRGELCVLAAEENGEPAAIAPFFVDGGMAFLVGSGGSDYLDLIGRPTVERMVALLSALWRAHPGLLGARFYHLPDASATGAALRGAAALLGLACCEEGTQPAPLIDLDAAGDAARAAASHRSLVRHQRRLERGGTLEVAHYRRARDIAPLLDGFHEQHRRRWEGSGSPSLFHDERHRAFYRRLADDADALGWLRFSVIRWDGRPVAYHFGFSHRGRYLWYKPSFDIDLARWSPGEVLLRQLFLAAADEGARVFDFGLGDEAFKQRFAHRSPLVRDWGLYPHAAGKVAP